MPARGHRACLRLAVTDDARDEQLRVVECGAECVGERVSELAAFVDRTGCLWSGVTRNTAREGELPEELPHAVDVLPDVGVALAVRSLEVRLRHVRRTSVTGTRDEDRIELPLANRPIEVHVHEIQPRRRPEVTEQTGLDVLRTKRFAQERVVEEVDLTDRQVVGRAPVAIERDELAGREAGHVGRSYGRPAGGRSRHQPMSLHVHAGSSLSRGLGRT